MFDDLVASTAGTHGASAVQGWARVENAACARRLAAMVAMLEDAYAADGSAAREQWCLDNWDAVSAHIGAAQHLTTGTASGLLLTAVALHDRLPKVAAVFADGLIDYRTVRAIVTRSTLLLDPHARRRLDSALSEGLTSWGPMSQNRLEQNVDALVEQIDPCAVRRTHTTARSRSLDVHVEDGSGLATVLITLFATDAEALSARADAFADTVCSKDPRTRDQRRADAINPMAHGNDRLACLCGRPECDAAHNPPSTGVVVYLVAHEDTLTEPPTPGTPDGPTTPPVPEDPDDSHGPDDSVGRGVSDGLGGRRDSDGLDQTEDPEIPEDHAEDYPNRSDGRDSLDGREDSHGRGDAPVPDATGDSDVADSANCMESVEITDESDRAADDLVAADPANEWSADDPATDRSVGDPAAEYAGLDGLAPPMFSRPLHELTWAQITAPPPPGPPPRLRPAAMMGGRFLPGALTRRAALGATLVRVVHPGQAPPEPRYRPSKKLADFVRCRDLTCRFPGCKEPATTCDLDHTIPWPYGPTQAANLKCLCRFHHLLKTFWTGTPGWRDRQHPDGTVQWTAPDGRTHTSAPGSRLLFPELCQPTAPVHTTEVPAQPVHTGGLKMPRRKTTRRQDRIRRIHDERQLNQALIDAEAEAKRAEAEAIAAELLPDDPLATEPSEPPPF